MNTTPKKIRIVSGIFISIALIFIVVPTYMREAIIHWFPDVKQLDNVFASNVIPHSDSVWMWEKAQKYNSYTLDTADNLYFDSLGTVAFLVIQKDSIIYEEYRDWAQNERGNLFSATKSIVSLLVGIALDEGKIKSVDDKVSIYLPECPYGDSLSIRNLLTMSSGLSFSEAYKNLFSITTKAYYGDNLRELIMNLHLVETPGKRFKYRSGDTQLLGFIIESATGMTLSDYAAQKLWKPMQTPNDALWSLDKTNGDEKAFCCFGTTARDLARFGRLILRNGDWNGKQLVSSSYLKEAYTPAYYLKDQFGRDSLNYYGYQTWLMYHDGMKIPYFRGLGGQYMYILPEKEAIIIRMGHKRGKSYIKERTDDIDRYVNIGMKILNSKK